MPTDSRVGKSETREMVERDRARLRSRLNEPTDTAPNGGGNKVFLILVVVIVAAVVLALVILK